MKEFHRGKMTSIVLAAIIIVVGAGAEELCRGEGLVANHTSGCRDYFRCRGGVVGGRYSCPSGLAFNAAARQCLPESKAPCVRHVCDSNDNHFYAAPGTQCRFYYKCEKGSSLELTCPVGSWFDFRKQSCTKSAGICYEAVCTGHVDGRYPDTTQGCRRTLVCSGGNLIAVESPGPLSEETCPSPRATAVAFPIASSDHCSSLPDGSYPAPGARCRDYIVCREGETQASMRCPDGFRFNGEKCAPDAETPCKDECSTLEDGFHVDLASGCKEYFYCQNKTNLLRTACSGGTVFDGQMCVSAAFYNCPFMPITNPCLNRADGYYRDPKDCQSYLYCSREEVSRAESCLDAQVWNGSACVDSSEFQCEGPIHWSGCADKSSGYYQDRTKGSDCKKYYYCSKNMRINFSCPTGKIFNGEECVQDNIYTCPSLEKDSCEFKPNGYYQQTLGDCRAYYMCSAGSKIIYLCDVNHVFDGKQCVLKSTYNCPYRTTDCAGKSNGYHPDVTTNCRKYYFCENGDKLTTLQCTGSKLFNGRGCVSSKEFLCPVGSSDNPCSYKEDGYYVLDGTKCRQFYKCKNSVVELRNTCPPNQIFDGVSSCVEKDCPVQTVTCDRNGFFMDLPSRCKKYHICIDKRKSTLECKDGQVFNGQLCVPHDLFQCPDECSQQHCRSSS